MHSWWSSAALPLCLSLLLPNAAAAAAAPPDRCGAEVTDRQQLAAEGLSIYRAALEIRDAAQRARALARSLRCFQAVQLQRPEPKLYHPMGLVQEKLGRDVEAAELFKRFLAEVPDTARSANITRQVEQKLSELRQRTAELSIDTVAGLDVRLDEQLLGTAPLNRLITVPPGAHVVTVGDAARGTLGAEVQVSAGQLRRVDLSAWRPRAQAPVPSTGTPSQAAAHPELAAAPPPRPLYKRPWFWGAVGGGAALVAGAVAAGVILGTRGSGAESLPTVRF